MEWYLVQTCNFTTQYASSFGVLQLIILAAVWTFKLSMNRPMKDIEL